MSNSSEKLNERLLYDRILAVTLKRLVDLDRYLLTGKIELAQFVIHGLQEFITFSIGLFSGVNCSTFLLVYDLFNELPPVHSPDFSDALIHLKASLPAFSDFEVGV